MPTAASVADPQSGTAGEPRRPGRPRSERADRAIIDAALSLFAEHGVEGLCIEEVAARAGVGKATVYRRWPSRGALALDAFLTEFEEQQPLPDTGSFHGDLLAALRSWMRSVTRTPAGHMLTGLVGEAQRDPALAAAWRDRVIEPLRARSTILLDRAISRGEIPADVDKDVVLDMMFGSAYHRLLNGHRPLTDQFARQVVDIIVAGVAGP